jgi:pimeloyl-ACP methyl ester carboxylesterase
MDHHDRGPTTAALRRGATSVGPYEARWQEQGADDGPVVLLLHGVYAGASGYEWRRLAPLLARSHRVRTVDLLGAGTSDRPDLAWSASTLTWAVQELIGGAGDGGPPIVIASSLTGAHAVRAVTRGAEVERLLLITPTGLGSAQTGAPPTWTGAAYAAGRHTPLGDLVVGALSSGPSVRWFQRHQTYRDPDVLTEDEVNETRRVARLPNAKHLQLAFVTNQLALALDEDEVAEVAPTVLWGGGQRFVDPSDPERWRRAGAEVTEVDEGLPQVESPEATAAWVERALPASLRVG